MTLRGVRDAGQNFELKVFDIGIGCGCERGLSNPCAYRHREWEVSFFHHGDDFVVQGKRGGVEKLRKALSEKLIIKHRGPLGPRDSDAKEMTILSADYQMVPSRLSAACAD